MYQYSILYTLRDLDWLNDAIGNGSDCIIAGGEQRILTAKAERADSAFGGVVVELDPDRPGGMQGGDTLQRLLRDWCSVALRKLDEFPAHMASAACLRDAALGRNLRFVGGIALLCPALAWIERGHGGLVDE